MTPIIISSLAIIAFSSLIHASFQLSVSVLTLVSGHSLGKRTAHMRVLRLMSGFIAGVFVLTVLALSALVYYLALLIHHTASSEQLLAAIICGLMVGLGIATWVFYYRKGPGTSLWLPRGFARHLHDRTKATKNSFEAFGLGMTSVVAELIFIIAPMTAAALAITTLPGLWWQIAGISIYALLSLAPLLIVFMLVGGGNKISRLQAWRESNKRFLQFVSGGSLLILAAFIFTDRVLGISFYGVF